MTDLSNRKRAERANRTATSIDILDLRKHAYFANFETVPASGRYRIKIRATGKDRGVYDSEQTGYYDDDPFGSAFILATELATLIYSTKR